MAVPFPNTELRVPRGFGNILEGLAREVLREQPEDIPTFAAQYFTALLQKREESGLDPAKWGALMEQRFSNNDAFKYGVNQENCSPVQATRTSLTEDRDFQVGLYEDKIAQNFSPSPETLDEPKDIVEPEPLPSKELMLEGVQEPASDDKENEAAEKELDPVTLSSYRGLADVEVCSEELRSALQEEEHTEASGDMMVTDAGFVPPSESSDPVSFEQDVLDTHDEFIPSGTKTPIYVEQYLDKKLHDIPCTEETVGSAVTGDEVGETGKENVFLDDAGPLHLNEGAEGVSASKTFDEMNADEIPLGIEKQQADDVLAAETISESSFTLEKASLANLSNEYIPGMEELANVISEVQEEINGCESDAIAATCETGPQTDIKEDETNVDKPTDPKHISKMIPVEDIEGLVGSNFNPTDFSAVDTNKYDSRTPQQVVVEVDDTSEVDKENNNKTEQDMSYKPSARDSQEHTEAPDYTESQNNLAHEPTFEHENKELDQQEESSQPQEEEDIMDIPLDDPEANKAAAKIQAGFRGHMTRKKLKPGDKPGEEVSSTGEALNGSQGDAAGGSEGVATDETSVPEQ